MNTIKVSAAALNQTPFDWDRNLANISEAVRMAKENESTILLLPELCATGYGCGDMFQSADFCNTAMDQVFSILHIMDGLTVVIGLPVHTPLGTFNCGLVVADRRPMGFVAKQNLARDGIHYEPRHFRAWRKGEVTEIDIVGYGKVPMGDLVFDLDGVRFGFEMCEDAWGADRPGVELARIGCDIILNPSASHFSMGKHEARKRLVIDSSRAFGVGYVYANLLGNEAGRVIYDGACLISSCGRLLATGDRLSMKRVEMSTAVLDIDEIRNVRAQGSVGHSCAEHKSIYCPQRVINQFMPTTSNLNESPEFFGKEPSEIAYTEFELAVTLGLFDYLTKSGMKGFVVSLSGGADSGAVSYLVYRMVSRALLDYGSRAFGKMIGQTFGDNWSNHSVTEKVLLCVYQRTKMSSEQTLESARLLSVDIGARFQCVDIDEILEKYFAEIMKHGQELRWDDEVENIAMQNVQARIRGVMAWAKTNLSGSLLLACNNKSESAVGYTTMHGDTCGSLCPIGGVTKTFLLNYLRYIAARYPTGFSSIKRIVGQKPTAELLPEQFHQTDEGDLGPYDLRDALQYWAVSSRFGPAKCLALAVEKFTNYPKDSVKAWTKLFFRRLATSQWKREQLAPALHVDDNNMDPKSWWRFPILNGMWKKELSEL
jgi:NAD+ synthase (glutamine-hydrolysing)